MTRDPKKLPAWFSFFGLLSLGSSWACSCSFPDEPLVAMGKADAVFAGRVSRVEAKHDFWQDAKNRLNRWLRLRREWRSSRWIEYEIETSELFKGEPIAVQTIYSPNGGAACGVDLSGAVLIYARRDTSGRLWTNQCMRTSALADADAEVDELRAALREE